jgi:hypothetical protein
MRERGRALSIRHVPALLMQLLARGLSPLAGLPRSASCRSLLLLASSRQRSREARCCFSGKQHAAPSWLALLLRAKGNTPATLASRAIAGVRFGRPSALALRPVRKRPPWRRSFSLVRESGAFARARTTSQECCNFALAWVPGVSLGGGDLLVLG